MHVIHFLLREGLVPRRIFCLLCELALFFVFFDFEESGGSALVVPEADSYGFVPVGEGGLEV